VSKLCTGSAIALAALFLLVGCPSPDPDDDGDDDSSGDDDTGDDDADDDDDSWYTDPGDLPEGAAPCSDPVLVELLEAVDGDTAWVDMPEGPHEKVRFIGIDTPEVGYDGEPDECYAAEATDFASSRLGGDRFWLTFDAECRDYYDRLLAYVHTRDGFFQLYALQLGFAETLAIEPNTTFADDFAQAQQVAQAADAGLWGECY
jgi:micrococcal nuclease